MSSYDITSIILNFFNTKYDKNELSGEKIMSSSNGNNISDNDINELYNTLLLAIEDTKKHDDVTLIDPVEDIINSLTKNVPNLENKDINSINFITDVEFVKKLLK
jgi:lysyl-tRNA synthetase class I